MVLPGLSPKSIRNLQTGPTKIKDIIKISLLILVFIGIMIGVGVAFSKTSEGFEVVQKVDRIAGSTAIRIQVHPSFCGSCNPFQENV